MTTTRHKRTGSKPPASLGRFGKPAASGDGHEDDLDALVPSGLAGAYVESKLQEEEMRTAGLEAPQEYEGEMPQLPDDIDSVDHSELSNLLLAFQSALATATWRASQAYIQADISEEVSDYLENRSVLASEQSNDTKRRAEAKTDDKVMAWRGRYKKAYHNYVSFRDLARTMEGKVKVLSRVGGFKDDEHEASDRSAKPKASRGSGRRSQ